MQNSGLQILGLTLGHVPNPVGILEPQMQFAWKGESDKPNATQTAYRIRVSLAGAENEKAVVWDSGKIESSRSSGYPYEGPPLKPATKYEWGVTVWDNHGREAESAPAHFTTGLRDEDWQGCWLGADDYSANDTGAVAPLFRKGFQVDGQVAQAMAYIAVVGYYEFSLNGAKVGNHVLDPGWTDFRQSVLYVAYDVTDRLKQGENAIGLMLGNGWYCNANAPLETIQQGPHFLFQLNIQYADGRLQSEYSQVRKGWQVNTAGPITDNSIYNGETYDARREISGWNTAPVAAAYTKEWRRPLWVDPPAGRLKPQLLPAIQVVKTLAPVDVRRFDDNTRVFDFGQNFSGWVRIRVKGAAGETVCMKFAENAYEDGQIDSTTTRAAEALDTYTLKGDGEEVYEPHFTYHGFRYVRITGLPEGTEDNCIEGRVVCSAVPLAAQFSCENELLNKLHRSVLWSEATNLHSVPTDCPQRDERLGWLNDMTVRAEEAIYNFDMAAFYTKWVEDIREAQGETTGAITDVAPFVRYGRRPADPVCSSYLVVPWLVYLHTGDTALLRRHFEGFQRWEDYLLSQTEDDRLYYSYFGDWCGPLTISDSSSMASGSYSAITSGDYVSTWAILFNAFLLVKIAKVLGKEETTERYLQLFERGRAIFNQMYLDEKTGQYGSGSQACNAFALYIGLVPDHLVDKVVQNLVHDVKDKNDTHLTTGNQATKYIFDVLAQHGHADLAYALASQDTYPSWGLNILNGATTIWERWEEASTGLVTQCCSQNHPMYASIGSYFHRYLVGITPDEEGPAFERVRIEPKVPQDLQWAQSELDTVKGKLACKWSKKDDSLVVQLEIPFNCTAHFLVPAPYTSAEITDAKGSRVEKEDILRIGSGCYQILCTR